MPPACHRVRPWVMGISGTRGLKTPTRLLERMTGFNVVDEGSHGNTRADKDRRTPQNLRVRANDGHFRHGAMPFKRCETITPRLFKP